MTTIPTFSIRELPKYQQKFFFDKRENVKYNSRCENCARECKQSFKTNVYCPKRIIAKTKRQYIREIKKQNKSIKEVANAIDIHAGTLNSMLTNRSRDITFEVHKKLMKFLFDKDMGK